MNNAFKTTLPLLAIMITPAIMHAQGMKMGEVIIVSTSALKKDIKPETFEAYITQNLAPVWNKNKPGASMHLFRADRGDRKGESLLVCEADKVGNRESLSPERPFTDKVTNTNEAKLSDFLSEPGAYTEYHLIGAEKFKSLPMAGILGIHYIKVKPDRSAEFEKFVIEKLHPAVGQLLPDLRLLYYKAVAGEQAGSYITIFTIASPATRDKYWPSGAPETEILKQAFKPLNALAVELSSYLVEGSYLEPGGGAAAYFESHQWTDFVHHAFLK